MRDEIINSIREIQQELADLGVSREYFNFRRLTDEDLRGLLESIGEQLETRKRFLGVK